MSSEVVIVSYIDDGDHQGYKDTLGELLTSRTHSNAIWVFDKPLFEKCFVVSVFKWIKPYIFVLIKAIMYYTDEVYHFI